MPPQLASLIYCGFVIWLFRRDIRQKPNVTGALWIPLVWFTINCSRPIVMWLMMFGLPVPGGSSEDGTPVDACFHGVMIAAGLYVLVQRRVTLAEFIRNNGWITVFLAWCFLSIFWSDDLFASLKRWAKVLGHPVMVLIVLTEPDPMEALTRLIKRCAYVVVPVSILFIKYYEEWGRSFDEWSGEPVNCGIAQDKNFLGLDCMIISFVFVWHLLRLFNMPRLQRDRRWRNELLLCAGFLAMISWLFYIANSKTPLVSLALGLAVMLFAGWQRINKKFIGAYLIGGILIFCVTEATFGIYASTIKLLGRNPDLTERVPLWKDLLKMDDSPVLGVGFESFWTGEPGDKVRAMHHRGINEAHNGYLETYLTLGAVGVGILVALLFAAYRKARAELLINVEWGRFRLGIFAAVVVFNWTEAAFRALDPMWTMFYFAVVDYPRSQLAPVPQSIEAGDVEEVQELVGQA